MSTRRCLGLAVVVGVALVPLLGTRPVLAASTTINAQSGCGGGTTFGSFRYDATGPISCPFTVPSGETLTSVDINSNTGSVERTYSVTVDGANAAPVVIPANATAPYVVTYTPPATVTAGSYTLALTKTGGDNVNIFSVVIHTSVPATTTTTAPPTTTTTAPATTTTTVPETTTTTGDACAWEQGGVVEAVPEPCDEAAPLPPWLLLVGGLLVFTSFAALVGGWRT